MQIIEIARWSGKRAGEEEEAGVEASDLAVVDPVRRLTLFVGRRALVRAVHESFDAAETDRSSVS